MATHYQKARVRITISDIILIASRKAHISGIEWSINFFTKELDMLKIDVEERMRKKVTSSYPLEENLLLCNDVVDVSRDNGDRDHRTAFFNHHANL